VGLYLAAEPELYRKGVLHLVPKKKRERAQEVLNTVGYTLRWWLLGQLVAMSFVFALSWAGLAALGVPLALTLAVISGLLTFIPFLGPIIAAIPAILVALMEGWQLALGVTLLYVVIQNAEGYIITPLVQRQAVELPPALTLTAEILMILLLGFFGLVFAVPLAAATMVAVKMIYVQDILGDEIEVLQGGQERQVA
jgi:predicted PurR-regulated permease PerM